MTKRSTPGSRITYYNVIDTFTFFDRELAFKLWKAFNNLNDDDKENYTESGVFTKIQEEVGRPIPLYAISVFFEALLKERSEFQGDDRMGKRYSTAIFEKMG